MNLFKIQVKNDWKVSKEGGCRNVVEEGVTERGKERKQREKEGGRVVFGGKVFYVTLKNQGKTYYSVNLTRIIRSDQIQSSLDGYMDLTGPGPGS